MSMTLLSCSSPPEGIVLAHLDGRVMQFARESREHNVIDEGALTCPGNARDRGHDAYGDLHCDIFEIVLARALDHHGAPRRSSFRWNLNAAPPRQKGTRGALFALLQ